MRRILIVSLLAIAVPLGAIGPPGPEAVAVAEAAGQIRRRCGSDGPDREGLFSENLY